MKTKDHRICFIGDSFVQGACDPECLGWAGRVAAAACSRDYNLSIYNLGIRRNTSSDIAARWQQECAARLPAGVERYTVFSFGINDTVIENGTLRVSTAKSVENFRTVISQAAALYRTLVVGPPPVADAEHNQRIASLCKQFEQIAAELNVPYIPISPHLGQDAEWIAEIAASDGHHPRARGYRRLADLVLGSPHWWFC